jgi:hypothetical protein
VSAIDIDFVLPTWTPPKFNAEVLGDKLPVSCPGAIPVPDRTTEMFGLVAVLAIDTLPLAVLADVGLKLTLRVMLWPAAKVTGRATPVRVKPGPEAVT